MPGRARVHEHLDDVGEHVLSRDHEHDEHEHHADGGSAELRQGDRGRHHDDDHRVPSCAYRAEHRRGKGGRVRRTPCREAVIDVVGPACARTTQERTPTATVPTTAASATVRRSPVVTCGSTRARTNVRTVACSTSRRTTAVVARGEAGSAAGQRRTAADTAAPAATATTTRTSTITMRGLPNVQSVKPKCMQTPSTAAGAVGVASQPTRARPSSQVHERDRRLPVRSGTGPGPANVWPSDSTAITRRSSRRWG